MSYKFGAITLTQLGPLRHLTGNLGGVTVKEAMLWKTATQGKREHKGVDLKIADVSMCDYDPLLCHRLDRFYRGTRKTTLCQQLEGLRAKLSF